ncbi:hypothetical protein BFT35_12020 [Thermoanaerobacterium thermosaccharolyticum]|uniref:pilus assembly PilX N-terminal domain-containing protein n=1 Tax=Thermoanaerobacterium thermosaccharolyticum TaxID=1517 RepID=UPI000C082F45|nr:pilus assembly PilX N-terminal domain-containing protein [Thermoanaerobacterium thermosaccharolyticum]PHO06289.1 hypothetical protein BFT35_12020 [Thermoanaerobacterium thermosaccharolyticum]
MINSKGSALIFTLMIILILSVLGISVLDLSLYDYKSSYAYSNAVSVNNAAEAGLDIAKGIFNDDLINNIKNIITNTANAIINEYNSLSLPQQVPREVLYAAIYQAVRQYLETNVFNLYQNYQYYLDDGKKINVTISAIKITDSYTYDDSNPLPKFTIKVETVGTYKNLKKYGHAIFILDLNKSGNPLSIQSWTIDNIPPSN